MAMKLSFTPQNFKGYDAAPLKAIHLEESTSEAINDEMKKIAQQEGFKLRYGLDYIKWTQDFKAIIEKNGQPLLIANTRVDKNYLDEVEQKYKIPTVQKEYIATGGNSFIGKYPNGEKWMLIGTDELHTKSYSYISEQYDIKKENIFPITQNYYHLDMFMRPIGYPFVLVNNPTLAYQKLREMDWKKAPYDYMKLVKSFTDFEKSRTENYASYESAIKSLKQAGFIPIEIAGVFGPSINFMNAIVNKHEDGTISYITNSSKCKNNFISNLEKEFEKELRSKVPNIDKIYFVQGSKDYETETLNYLTDNLMHRGGGIHCMTMEEPNFKAWA